jgi:uncharacterized protein (TIGR02246 family)
MIDFKSDEQVIRQIFAMLQLTWNSGDASTLMYDFVDDAEFITVDGELLKGREQIFNHYAALLSSTHGRAMISLAFPTISFLSTTTAFGYAEIQLKNLPGKFTPCIIEPTYALLILRKEDQQWQIIQGRHRFRSPA